MMQPNHFGDPAVCDSEESYRLLIENALEGIFLNQNGKIAYANAAMLQLLGASTLDDLLGRDVFEIVSPSGRALAESRFSDLHNGYCVTAPPIEQKFVRRDGGLVDVEVAATRCVYGQRPAIQVMVKDLSSQSAQLRFRTLVELAPDAIVVVDAAGRIVLVNGQTERLFGYARDELLGQPLERLVPERFATKHVLHRVQFAAKPEARAMGESRELLARRRDGSEFRAEIMLSPLLTGGEQLVASAIRDVTERTRLQTALASREKLLRTMIDAEPECIKLVSREGVLLQINPAGLAMIEADSVEDLAATPIASLVLPAYRAAFNALSQSVFAGRSGVLEFELRGLKGTQRWLETHAVPLHDEANAVTTLLGITRDITARKEWEGRLQESELRFRQIAENIREVFWVTSSESQEVVYVSPAYEDIWGRTRASLELDPLSFIDGIHPDDRPRMLEALTSLQAGHRTDTEYRVVRPDGSQRWIRDRGFPVYDSTGKLYRLTGIAEDISERKAADDVLRRSHHELDALVQERTSQLEVANRQLQDLETAARESEQFARSVLDALSKHICVIDTTGCIVMVNRRWLEFAAFNSGAHEAVSVGSNYLQQCDSAARENSDAAAFADGLRSILSGKLPEFAMEYACHSPTEQRWYLAKVTPFEGPNPRYFVVAHENITQRKQAELLLAGEQQILGMIARGAELGEVLGTLCHIVEAQVVDVYCSILLLDRATGRLRHGAAPSLPPDYNQAVDGFLIGPNAASCGTAAYTGRPVVVTDIASDPLWAQYKEVPLGYQLRACWSSPILDVDGSVLGTIALYRRQPTKPTDAESHLVARATALAGISISRLQAEDRLRASLAEKEVLLKEIYHRVKNNLQIITSLLSLQGQHLQEPAAREALRESGDRVASMALVHEKLYQSADLTNIDFEDYLHGLTDHLLHSYCGDSSCIEIRMTVANVMLGIDTAIPCGLIINELMSNAIKHAFPAERHGQIDICLSRESDALLKLTVSDNGVGLPKGICIEKSRSLGLKLVSTLVKQIQGTLQTSTVDGTHYQMTFPNST